MLRTTVMTAALLAFGLTTAYAQSFSTNVSYGDLDLSQPSSAQLMADRLQQAAASVCLKAYPEIDPGPPMQNCIDAARAQGATRVEARLNQSTHADMNNVRAAMSLN